MRKILLRAVALILILSMFTATIALVPLVATENIAMAAVDAPVYVTKGTDKTSTYYKMLKDYNTVLAHNKKKYKAQRTDSDAIEKYALDTRQDKDIIALAKEITASSKDEYAKIKAIYYWVAENIYYDSSVKISANVAGDVVASDPVVVYERKRAVCAGYTSFTVALLRAIGIPAKSVSGAVYSSSKDGHAWTEVWLSKENRWLIMDTTWGSGNTYSKGTYKKGKVQSKYFDMSLETFSKTHIIDYTSEVLNKVHWHWNVKGKSDAYVPLPYKSAVTWKKPPENPGYKFGGWYKDEALTTKFDFDKEKLLTDIHLYGKWIAETYTVTFDSNGGSPVPSIKAKYNERITKPQNPTRKGYLFAGWTYKKNGSEFWNFIREPNISTVKKNITLYASWQKPYTITFDSNGGTSVPSGKTGLYGVILQPSVTPKKDGYTFAGWYRKKKATDADRPIYFGETKVNADTTIYARWTPGGSKSGSATPTPTPVPGAGQPTPIITPTPTPGTGITPDLTAAPLENGTYAIQPATNTKLSIDVPGSSMLDVTALIYYKSTTNDNQKFNLTRVGDYQYTITAVHSGKNWTSSGILGGQIKQSTANDDYKQIFTIMKYSDGYYRIQDSEGYFVGTSSGKAALNTSVLMWTEASDRGQEFILTKQATVSPVVTTPTPTPTPPLDGSETPIVSGNTPTPTPEPSLIPDKLESITYATKTNPQTIKEGWYYFVLKNNYIRVNDYEAMLSKETYANYLYISSMGGRIYTIMTPYGTYLTTKDIKPRSGDKVLVEMPDESNILTGWIIEADASGTNVFTIRPVNNKDLILSAEGGSLKLTNKPSKAENTKITIFAHEP